MEKMTSILRKTEKVVNVTDEEELRKRGYVVGSTLGEGSYAKVKSAYSDRLNRKVALKIINRKKAPKDFQQKFLPRELEVMKVIQHSNIIQMFEIMQFNDKVYIAMEIAGHGDLLEYIKLRGAISEDRSRIMFQQLVGAVDYLHKNNIIHRDLKCENILLDTQSNLKISDFGFARFLMPEDHSKTFCGSAAYAAPEILQGIPYKGTTYDVWSMGVILYIMVCGSMPFDDSNIKKMIKYQTEKKVGFSRSKKLSQEVKDLIHNMLDPSTRTRFTIYQIQHCTWLIELIQNVKKMESRSLPSADKPKSTPISPSPQPAKPQTPQPLVSNTPAPAASPPNTASPTDTQPKPQPQPQPPKDHQFQRVAKISAPKSKSVDLITEGIHSMRAS